MNKLDIISFSSLHLLIDKLQIVEVERNIIVNNSFHSVHSFKRNAMLFINILQALRRDLNIRKLSVKHFASKL
jgi:hypothetical protein